MYPEGTVIGGRYRLLHKIGEGGMATVWKAEHLTLGSPVAVKFLQSGGGSTAHPSNERFMREARAAASVRHRNVIEITDFGVTDDDVPYMVLELLEGQNLAERLDSVGRLDLLEACRIITLTLRGLAAVHDAGIVHRDLKPENIFLVADADGVFPKLLDFGVSRRAEAVSTSLTQEGILVGTPDYMSPEQARGLRDIDARTDIYSIGVILYEAMAGRLPFQSENLGDLIVLITTQEPPPLQSLVADVPDTLAQVVQRALRKKREERFGDAREMRRALLEAVNDLTPGEAGSSITSISEFPPEAGRVRASTPEGPRAEEPVQPAPRPAALGAAPRATAVTSRVPRSRSPVGWVGAVLLVATAGVGAYATWGHLPTRDSTEPDRTQGKPWNPATTGELPPELLDAGSDGAGAGAEISITITGVPDAGRLRIDGVPVASHEARVPASGHRYRVEVTAPDGGVLWRALHPGTVDGYYQAWPMGEEELARSLPDGGVGVSADGGLAEDATTEGSTNTATTPATRGVDRQERPNRRRRLPKRQRRPRRQR